MAEGVAAPEPIASVAAAPPPPPAPPVPVATARPAEPDPLPVDEPDADDSDGEAARLAASTDGVSLHELARAAAMDAEREAINLALTRFRWNRRKTAAHLKVSYKTLLNKMKECGIRGADLA